MYNPPFNGVTTANLPGGLTRGRRRQTRMNRLDITNALIVAALLLLPVTVGVAQKKGAAPTTGGVKGKVKVDAGHTAGGVLVAAQRGEDEVARAETDAKGNYTLSGLAPGVYTLTFRKAGLKTAQHREVEVRAGKVKSLGDKVFLPVDEGSIAFVRGSVFDSTGRSVEGAQVEIALIGEGGAARKVDGRVTTETGTFSFRLPPEAARYRVTAKSAGREGTKEIEVEGALVYRVALSLKPAAP